MRRPGRQGAGRAHNSEGDEMTKTNGAVVAKRDAGDERRAAIAKLVGMFSEFDDEMTAAADKGIIRGCGDELQAIKDQLFRDMADAS